MSNINKESQREQDGLEETDRSEEDIPKNVNDVARTGDLSPRKIRDLKKDKRNGRIIGTKNSQIQTRSSLAKPASNK